MSLCNLMKCSSGSLHWRIILCSYHNNICTNYSNSISFMLLIDHLITLHKLTSVYRKFVWTLNCNTGLNRRYDHVDQQNITMCIDRNILEVSYLTSWIPLSICADVFDIDTWLWKRWVKVFHCFCNLQLFCMINPDPSDTSMKMDPQTPYIHWENWMA